MRITATDHDRRRVVTLATVLAAAAVLGVGAARADDRVGTVSSPSVPMTDRPVRSRLSRGASR